MVGSIGGKKLFFSSYFQRYSLGVSYSCQSIRYCFSWIGYKKKETKMTVICPYCGKEIDVARKIEDEYAGVTLIICPFCNKEFAINFI